MKREHRVILLRRHDRMPGDHVDPHKHADENRYEEKGDDGKQIQQADAFMVRGKEPAEDSWIFPFFGKIGRV